MLQTAAKVFGGVLLFIGILGFIPGVTPDNHLLGIFHVDTLHNLIHVASGAAALMAGYSGVRASRMYFQIFGLVYALVAVLGFIYGDNDIFGVLANNIADTILHVVIAGSALALGFSSSENKVAADDKDG